MEYNIETMAQEIEEIKGKVDIIGSDVSEMKSALLGNKYGTEKGVVHVVDYHGKRLDEIDKKLVLIGQVDDHEERLGKLEKNVLTQSFIKTVAAFILGAIGFKLFESFLKSID